jgi:hypothetical protein
VSLATGSSCSTPRTWQPARCRVGGIVGAGIIDFRDIFAACMGAVWYDVVEHEARARDPTFDTSEAAQKGFVYLDCVTFGTPVGGLPPTGGRPSRRSR